MKILYFDTLSLLYSNQYIHSKESLYAAFDEWLKTRATTLLKMVRPDSNAVDGLRSAASEAGLLLYPLGTRHTRTCFIENGVFTGDEFAPDTELPFRTHMDDNNSVRQMLAHAHSLKAQWYVCGDVGSEELLQHYLDRYLRSEFGKGVTSELISKIRGLKPADY
ncbi:hypothetical protein [Vibrio parahaemolyticus]|uniref:hypothetical protein n=1 Tax=Vibrio parahaemolyticus TaxID=670 RepID=UPI000D73E456|nr:hypothetical protein [Vibrio parahaemolyticus]EGQ7796069.1 hypothetical protein [Vibrio parahaemolyticus]MCX4129177.1 hypothetical protein [Vibrio parahaemolyticus]PXB15024.1 hypothetical protein CXR47_22745 [Vibrio parahaemolyticus]HBN6095669.1 hypothetical protein [Vibrio parahaemolyticus]